MESKPDPTELRRAFYALPDDAWVDRDTAGAVAHLGRASMEQLAMTGGGPTYTRLGRRALYRKRDVLEWISKRGRSVKHTAQLAAE